MTLMLSASVAGAAEPDAANRKAAAKVAVELCSACHGPGGNSTSPLFPRLAGQQRTYVAAQLRAFKSKSRADPEAHDYMWGMAATVDDSLIDALGEYFASQPPAPGTPGDPKLIAEGKKLYENGVPSRNIPACGSCHGPDAEGAAVFPRLAGQHAEYVVRQLHVIQTQLRASPVMHGIIKELTPQEMRAIAVFLESK